MRYAALKENDIVNGEGVVVSLFMQGCPHHCHGCFNQETWDPQGGKEIDINKLIEKIDTTGCARILFHEWRLFWTNDNHIIYMIFRWTIFMCSKQFCKHLCSGIMQIT